jgi:hypothetical protein
VNKRTITLATRDAGDVPVFCPPWCRGHADHVPEYLVDLSHTGDELPLYALGQVVGGVHLTRFPYAQHSTRETQAYAHLHVAVSLGPEGLDQLAAALVAHASILRRFARELSVILAGGAQ